MSAATFFVRGVLFGKLFAYTVKPEPLREQHGVDHVHHAI